MPPTALLDDQRAPSGHAIGLDGRAGFRPLIKVALLAASVAIWFIYTGGRSPWIELNLPGGIHGGNPASGYTSLYNGDFYHKENFYALQHIDLIKGNYDSFQDRIGFCDRRMFYAVAGNVLTLLFSSYHALRLINLMMFLLCADFVRRMSEQLFGDADEGLFAAALFVFSTMATVHVGDVSPHFVAFAFYYGWAILMVQLAQRREPLTFHENLGHASLLGLWSLTYTSFAYGLAIYLVVLAKRREGRLCAAPALACYLMPQLQLLVVRWLGFGYSTDVEKLLMTRGLEMHLENFSSGPLSYSLFLVVEFVNYLVNDNPLNVFAGLAALVCVRHPAKWVLWLVYFMPIAIVFPFIGTTTARGYVVAGNTIVLFPLAAHGLFAVGRRLRARFGPTAPRLLLGSALLIQIMWGQGSLLGWHFPTGSYAMGIGKHLLIAEPQHFARISGNPDDKPILHGGQRTAASYFGLETNFGKQPVLPAHWRNPFASLGTTLRMFRAGCAVVLPVLICTIGVLLFYRPAWWGRNLTVSLAILLPMSLLLGAAEGVDQSAYWKFEDRIEVREGEQLVVKVPISAEFRAQLQLASEGNPTSQLHAHFRGNQSRVTTPAELRLFDQPITETRLTIPTDELIRQIDKHDGLLECTITPAAGSGGIQFRSWQKNEGSDRRIAEVVASDGSKRNVAWFPSIEIRVLRGEQNYPFKSLESRWDPAIPVGYALVGF